MGLFHFFTLLANVIHFGTDIIREQGMGQIIFYAISIFIVVAVALSVWRDRKDMKLRKKEYELKKALLEQQQSAAPGTFSLDTIRTKDLFLDTLTQIGCQYRLNEEDDRSRVYFAYQGENFIADTNNEYLYVQLWDTNWGSVELYDIDEVSRLRKAINTANIRTTVTSVFTIDEDAKGMSVHSRSTIPFLSTTPQLDKYLKNELDGFFHAHFVVRDEMEKLREKEKNA